MAGAMAAAGTRVVPSPVQHQWVNRCAACGATWEPGSSDEFQRRALRGKYGDDTQRIVADGITQAAERAKEQHARSLIYALGILLVLGALCSAGVGVNR